MRENIIIKIFRFFIPLRETKSDNREKEDYNNLNFREQTGEDLKIQVDDETPDFLKDLGQDVSSPSVESQTEDKNQEQEGNGNIAHPHEDVEPNDDDKSTSKEKKEEPEEPIEASLLDNKPLVKMFGECADVIKNIERIRPAFESEDCQDLINTVREQLVQAMILSGGKTIDNEKEFDTLRHKCKRGICANDGDKIINTLEPGVTLENRVFVKALVEIAKN
jgi:hypothetical protein